MKDVAFSPDGKRLATASTDNTASIWDISKGSQVLNLRQMGSVNGVAFGFDGRRLATASDDGSALIWDLSGGQGLLTFASPRLC